MLGILISLSIVALFVTLTYLYADIIGNGIIKFIKFLGGKENE